MGQTNVNTPGGGTTGDGGFGAGMIIGIILLILRHADEHAVVPGPAAGHRRLDGHRVSFAAARRSAHAEAPGGVVGLQRCE